MFLGPAELWSWEITPLTHRKLQSFNRFIEQSWRGKLDQQGRIVDGLPWIMPTAFDPIQCEFRSMFIGPPAITRGELFVKEDNKTKNTPLLIPGPRIPRGQISPWKYRVVRQFHWLDRKPKNMTEPDYFVKQLQEGLGWVIGSMEPWLRMTPEQAYVLDQEFHGTKFYKIYGLSDRRVKFSAEKDEPQLIIETALGDLMDVIDTRRFLGEFGEREAPVPQGDILEPGDTLEPVERACVKCGCSTHEECQGIAE